MADDLNAFLDGTAAEEEPAPAPEAPPAEAAALDAPAPDAPPEPDADPEPEAADEAGIRKALAAERDKRRDWKEKAIRAEGEMAELRRQLEAARQPPQQRPEQYQPIDPNTDPQGFVARVQQVAVSSKLDMSEMMLRKEIGPEKVDAVIKEFKEAAQENETLYAQLYAQPHPYEWAHQQVEARRLQKEIGTDPNGYRSRVEAELRAKWEAERGEPPLTVPTRSPAAGLPPSLATARNAAPRGATPFTGPPPLEDVFGR